MRVGIVNDIPMAREALRRVIADMPGYSIAWSAADGAEAVARCAEDTPDLVLMDLIMPVMDGVTATRSIMANSPCAVVVVTATVESNNAQVFEALGAGALDAIQTPVVTSNGQLDGALLLQYKMEAVRRVITANKQNPCVDIDGQKHANAFPSSSMVVVGASAGGPAALATILRELPSTFPAPIVIVQHIDEQFAPSLADWLNDQSVLRVRIAREHDRPQPGTVYVAASNDHLILKASQTLGYTNEPRHSHYRPSIDVFFESVAKHWKGRAVAMLLTGMGRDGAKGLKNLRLSGAATIAQDAQSCVVYGMPKAAAEMGAAVEILPLERMASHLMNSLSLVTRRALP